MVIPNINPPLPLITSKFIRKKELTMEHRLHIAFTALMDNSWGIITKLAKDYRICRPFVYTLHDKLYQAANVIFGDKTTETEHPDKELTIRKKAIEVALILRLIGKCSITATSEIMKRLGYSYNSVGSISQILNQIGSALPEDIVPEEGCVIYVYLASDEVYSHSRPILISADPLSSTIIKIELGESRKTCVWIEHFNKIQNNGIAIVKIISDEGIGLTGATEKLNIPRQSDTFHAISHRLGKWVNSMYDAACAKINEEYHQIEMFYSAKTEKSMQKRLDLYISAQKEANEAIELYDYFRFLYNWIIENLRVFDNNGELNNRNEAEEIIRMVLDVMITFPVKKLQKTVNSIYKLLDGLLDYLDTARKVTYLLKNEHEIPEYLIKLFSLLWQYERNQIKAKKNTRLKYYKTKKQKLISLLKEILNEEFEEMKDLIYSKLDTIVQSSAIVENINSMIRDYLNTSRNHIQQNMLNLIMFYHNHRRYKAGKRKGKTPMELLTGRKQQEDWVELLCQEVDINKILQKIG